MNMNLPNKQRGAVLLVALVMLLVLTLLAVSNMRGVTLESRITANRAHETQAKSAAEAALREAEFRFYGPTNIADKLEANKNNCSLANTLKENKFENKPCLLEIKAAMLGNFFKDPSVLTAAEMDTYLDTNSIGGLGWMPYRGLDAKNPSSIDTAYKAEWNSLLAVSQSNAGINAEYGMVAEGKGLYFYLNNGKTNDNLFLQSTHANISVGLNN